MSWKPFLRKKNAEKYGRKKTEVAGHWFDSKLEAAVYQILLLRERAGEISELKHHPGTVFLTEARIQFRPDFAFFCHERRVKCFAEAKGFVTRDYALKRRLWKSYGPAPLYVYSGSYASPRLTETIIPKGTGDA